MDYAIVVDGRVIDAAVADEPLAENWVPLTGEAGIGDLYDAGTGMFSRPVPSAAERRQALVDAVTERRWAVETGGVDLPDGTRIATGTDDQNRITSVIANAELAGVEAVDFKAANGWVTLTLPELRAVAAAVALHVQASFTAERAHHEAIAALPDAALAEYDITTGWPPNPVPETEPI